MACRLGTAAAAAGSNRVAAAAAAGEAGEKNALGNTPVPDRSADGLTAEHCLSAIRAYVDARVAVCVAAADTCGGAQSSSSGEEACNTRLQPLPASASDAELELLWASLETSLKTVRC